MEFGYGVDVFALARARGITILENDTAKDGLRGAAFRKAGRWHILVNKFDSFERKCFTVAHELAEIEYDEQNDLTLDEKHHRANIRAGELLLPEETFRNYVFNYSLIELKELFPACSYEVIARRVLRFREGVLTIFDNGEITARTGTSQMRYPSLPSEFERSVVRECYRSRTYAKKYQGNLCLESYYIDINKQIERVILFAFIRDDFY